MEVIRGKGIDSRHEALSERAGEQALTLLCAGIVYSAAFGVRVPSVHGTGLDVQMASCFLENDDRATTPDETR
ncbi:Uncharacterized protein APZ42_025408 [Daphnia magna]|uniref:Uncharacterized protein n=1 Tax=Daphnia magna TaxID=35525 RepID=A0A164T4K0_9CRUS|nr:Uncharacterized protein APZ42_025408 [Daphnia magna]